MLIVVANPTLGPHRAVIDEVSLPGFEPKGWQAVGPWSGVGTLTDAERAAAEQAPTVAPPKKKQRPTKRES